MAVVEVMLGVNIALLLIAIVLLLLVLRRGSGRDSIQLTSSLATLEKGQERTERAVREEIARNREEVGSQAKQLREETGSSLKNFSDSFRKETGALTQTNEQKLEAMRQTIEKKLADLQADNAKKLEAMRKTVDEKLQETLDRRLTESFKFVSERLEQVHKGLGDMRNLASGVGDLKKVLTNVKARGTWGEIQLGNLLEQILSPEQYAQNVATKEGSNERVEFAIKLPGRDSTDDEVVWLPIDAKFPMEDYQRLVEAADRADADALEASGRQLEACVKASAKDIHDKYLNPPGTTDFGVMFLPSEGLYAETLRRPGLVEQLQRDYRVNVAGPTTLAALLNSLQMGFRTLAIQKRSSEVWTILGAVKTEFGKFGQVIGKVQKKLQEASGVIDSAQVRTRAIDRKLRDVQELPAADAQQVLGDTGTLPPQDVEDDAEANEKNGTGSF